MVHKYRATNRIRHVLIVTRVCRSLLLLLLLCAGIYLRYRWGSTITTSDVGKFHLVDNIMICSIFEKSTQHYNIISYSGGVLYKVDGVGSWLRTFTVSYHNNYIIDYRYVT